MDPLKKLPLLPLFEIFTGLQGGSLQRCRMVSRAWKYFIDGYIYGTKMNVKLLEQALEENWRNADYLEEVPLYFDFPVRNVKIEDASSRFIAVKKITAGNLRNTRLFVFELNDHMFWELSHPFRSVYRRAKKNEFFISVSNELMAVRVPLKGEEPEDNLQVFSMKTRSKIMDENILGLFKVELSRTEFHPELLVLFTTTHVVVWQVLDDHVNQVYISNTTTAYVSGCFLNGTVVNSVYFEDADRSDVTVWEISTEPLGISVTAKIKDLDQYFTKNGKRCGFHVNEITWVGGFFVLGCQVPNPPGLVMTSSLCIRVATKSGEVLKEFKLAECAPDSLMSFYIHNERLIIAVENKVLILRGDIKNIGKGSNLNFQEIRALPGNFSLMIKKFVANSASVVTFLDGSQMLKLTQLHFWRKN